MGETVVKISTIPKSILTRELKMCYTTFCLIKNYVPEIQKKITQEEVVKFLKEKTDTIKEIMKNIVAQKMLDIKCDCKD